MEENKGKAEGNQVRRGKGVMSYKERVQINCSRSRKVSSCKVVTDYKNDDRIQVDIKSGECQQQTLDIIYIYV